MPLHDLIFEKKISMGNLLEISMIIGSLIWATAYVKADLEAVKKDHTELRFEYDAHEMRTREQIHINDQTYVRKDVLDQVLKQLEQIQNSLNRLDAKVSK